VEALVGIDAFRFLARESLLVSQLTEQLKTPRPDLAERIAGIVARLRDAERDLQRAQSARLANVATELAAAAANVNGVAYVAHQAPDGTAADGIRKLALDVRGQLPADRPGVVVIASVPAERPAVVVAVTDQARARGLAAGSLIVTATGVLGGRGGGRDDVAQGGGAELGDAAARLIAEAFGAVQAVIEGVGAAGSVT
jgi:alanyl-tRNA synthetase